MVGCQWRRTHEKTIYCYWPPSCNAPYRRDFRAPPTLRGIIRADAIAFLFYRAGAVFAAVISIVTVIVGAIAAFTLPIAQFPEIAPPNGWTATVNPGA